MKTNTTKTITSALTLIFFSMSVIYATSVWAEYVTPPCGPSGCNTPSPILVGELGTSQIKLGKLGVGNSISSTGIDLDLFPYFGTIFSGQLGTDALATGSTNKSGFTFKVRGTSSTGYSLFVGNPLISSMLQKNIDNSDLIFKVNGETKSPYVLVGSNINTTQYPSNANYIFELNAGSKSNIGFATQNQYASNTYRPQYLILTEKYFRTNGCPAGTYVNQILPYQDTSTTWAYSGKYVSVGGASIECVYFTPQADEN